VTFSASGGHFHLDLPIAIAIAIVMLLLVWVFNSRGIRSTVWFSSITGILLMIPLPVMMLVPYLGHERPGTVSKGPPITVRCPCGQTRELAHGEVWGCDSGRRWNTTQIDSGEYHNLRRLQLRFRLLPISLGVATSLVALFLISSNSFSLFLLLPAVLVGWGMVLRPLHRQRYAAALGRLPRWQLRPE
jgi:hypothetical protein